jgi:hypothetical protein
MCENMVVSEVCAVSEVLCSVFYGHYTKSSNCSVSDDEKGDMSTQRVSRISGTCVSLLLNMHKKECLQNILQGILLAPTRKMPVGTHTHTYVCQWACAVLSQKAPCGAQAI